MKRGYTALEYRSIVRRLRAGAPGPQPVLRLHRRLPRRDRGRLRGHAAARARAAASTARSPSSTARARARRPPTCPTTRPHEEKLARLQRLQAQLDAQARAISEAMVGTHAARAGRRACRRKSPAELAGAHRQQPRGELSRAAPALDRSLRRRAHHRGAAAFAARRTGLNAELSRSKSSSTRSTTSASRACAARSTRTCARSSRRSTSRIARRGAQLHGARRAGASAPRRRSSISTTAPRAI